jgi:hypothetical protein
MPWSASAICRFADGLIAFGSKHPYLNGRFVRIELRIRRIRQSVNQRYSEFVRFLRRRHPRLHSRADVQCDPISLLVPPTDLYLKAVRVLEQ